MWVWHHVMHVIITRIGCALFGKGLRAGRPNGMAEKPEDLSLPASVVARIIKDAVGVVTGHHKLSNVLTNDFSPPLLPPPPCVRFPRGLMCPRRQGQP